MTEILALLWLIWILVADLLLWVTGRETISQMMTRFGKAKWWIPLAYVVPLVYLFFHFWPWLWPL